MDGLFVELCSQLRGSTARAGILPGEQGHQCMIRGIHSNETMPEGVGRHRADLRRQRTGGCKRLIYRLSDVLDEHIGINRDLTFIRCSKCISMLCLYTWDSSTGGIKEQGPYRGSAYI